MAAITGSTGKTSTKDILAALLAPLAPTVASPENHNTEIGLPLAILDAGEDVQVLVLEMAMRGAGQIAQLTAIAEPDVGVVVNVGPAHLELLGSLEAVAAAKAELIAGLRPGRAIVLPFGEPLLSAHLRSDVRQLTFGGPGGRDARRERPTAAGGARGRFRRCACGCRSSRRTTGNLLRRRRGARALGYRHGPLRVGFSEMRGQRVPGGRRVLIDDSYNANPMSMRAALEDLAASAPGRRVAVLGEMLELGPQAPALHREIGRYAAAQGVELLVAVGPLAAEMAGAFDGEAHTVPDAERAVALLEGLLAAGDTVLVKASRGVGLERVSAALAQGEGTASARTRHAASERL